METTASSIMEYTTHGQTAAEKCMEDYLELSQFLHGKEQFRDHNYTWQFNQMTEFCLENEQTFEKVKTEYKLPAHMTATMNVLTKPIYGYVFPVIGVFTLFTNVLVCMVLLKKHMRNPTNVLLAAMAISDLLTGIIPLPMFLYMYTFNNYYYWVSCPLYYAHAQLAINLPTIFHTASIWLTVALAVQRYICVCRPLDAKKWCTVKNILIVIVVIYLVAVLSQLSRSFDMYYMSVKVPALFEQRMTDGCIEQSTVLSGRYATTYWMTYWWFRVICVHLIPCSTLVFMNVLLINTMRAAQTRREQLLKQNRNCEGRRLQENSRTTFMLVAVVGLFLLVELPMAVIFILFILNNSFYPDLMDPNIHDLAALISNTFILLSYPLNFFIYCAMSRLFRETFIDVMKQICRRKEEPAQPGRPRYFSLSTENGNRTVVTNETAM